MVPRSTGAPRMQGVSLSRLWTFLASALPALAAVVAPMSTVDLAYQLRAGSEIVATGAIPTVDGWTFTIAGRPWVDQQWLAQIVLHLAHAGGDWTAVVVLRALLTAITFAGIFGALRRSGLVHRDAALLTLVAFLIAAPAMAMRPQLMGMACFGIALFLLASRRRHIGYRVALVGVAVVWANVHGSFFLAPVLAGLAWVDDLIEKRSHAGATLALAVATGLATALTPLGPMVWAYALQLSADPEVTTRISEWQPTSVREPVGLVFFASLGGVVVILVRSARTVRWSALLALAVFAFLGLYAERGIAWWGLMLPTLIAAAVSSRGAQDRALQPVGLPVVNLILAASIVLAGIALLPWSRPLQATEGSPLGVLEEAPVGISEALERIAAPGDRVYNPQLWGSWIEYRVPEVRVAIDSRIELYDAQTMDAYDRIAAGAPGWEQVLARWGVDHVIVRAEAQAFGDRLVAAGWTQVYQDADGAILTRTAAP